MCGSALPAITIQSLEAGLRNTVLPSSVANDLRTLLAPARIGATFPHKTLTTGRADFLSLTLPNALCWLLAVLNTGLGYGPTFVTYNPAGLTSKGNPTDALPLGINQLS